MTAQLPRALPALITVCVPSGGEYSDEKVTVIILVVHAIEEYKYVVRSIERQ